MNNSSKSELLDSLSLGKATEYGGDYDPGLLQAVPRVLNRIELGVEHTQPFFGEDVWNAYELSWLNEKGKPVVALARISIPFNSECLVESKSLKLYLNSLNQTRFASMRSVLNVLTRDLEALLDIPVTVNVFSANDLSEFRVTNMPGECLDDQDIIVKEYQLTPSLLQCAGDDKHRTTSEILHSHLLKSNCLITNQPDWATVIIDYSGQAIDREALLRYLISFRQHNEFHEQCVERIFMDLLRTHKLSRLSVQALYTRRGGLDINPFRSTDESAQAPLLRINRQ